MVHEQVERGEERPIRDGCQHTLFLKISLLILNIDSEASGHGNFRDIVTGKKSLNDRFCLKAVVLFCGVGIRAFRRIIFLWFLPLPSPSF